MTFLNSSVERRVLNELISETTQKSMSLQICRRCDADDLEGVVAGKRGDAGGATRARGFYTGFTASGAALATSVKNSGLAEDTKARLVREIIEYEASHGSCTKTFERKIRKQL